MLSRLGKHVGIFKKNKHSTDAKGDGKRKSTLASELRREMLDESPYETNAYSSNSEIEENHQSIDTDHLDNPSELDQGAAIDQSTPADQDDSYEPEDIVISDSLDSVSKSQTSEDIPATPSNLDAFFAIQDDQIEPAEDGFGAHSGNLLNPQQGPLPIEELDNIEVGDLPHHKAGLSNRDLLWIYSKMIECRILDETMSELSRAKRAPFTISSQGQEASQVAFAAAITAGADYVVPYYRDLGIVLTLGMAPLDVLLALLGKANDPNSGGRQMPNHWSSPELRVISSSSLIANHITHGVGLALGVKEERANEVVFVTFSSSAVTKGEFHEALNFAALRKLPIVFLCEDSGSSDADFFLGGSLVVDLTRRCGAYGIHFEAVDAIDPITMYSATSKAKARAIAGEGATLIVTTYDRSITSSTSIESSIASSRVDDPLAALQSYLKEHELITEGVDQETRAIIRRTINDAVNSSEGAPDPDPSTLTQGVFVANRDTVLPKLNPRLGNDDVINLATAINEALADSMVDDHRVMILGEEIGAKGGVFRVTAGLHERFGSARIVDMPLAESSMVGIGIGLALSGKRPIIEIQFADFIYAALDQLISEASKMAYRTAGRVNLQMVIRAPYGSGVRGGLYHSQSIESLLAHVPGLKVVVPSNVQNAYDLMRAAIDDPNPVVFLEPKRGYRSIKGIRYSEEPPAQIGRASVARMGRDLCVITYGEFTQLALEIAAELSPMASIEVVDLLTLSPLDTDTIIQSVRRCAKALIVHEDNRSFGVGSEISAIISEECLMDLDAPVVRLAGPQIPMMPYSPSLESAATIGLEEMRKAIVTLLQS